MSPTKRTAPPAEPPARRFLERFAGHPGAHGTYALSGEAKPGEKHRGRALTVKGGPSLALWAAHLAGKGAGLGVVPIRPDGTVRWGAVDRDRYDLKLPELEALIRKRGLPLVPCRSKSGGAHLLCFTTEPVKAALMRARLQGFAALLDLPESVEIFPKQTALGPKDTGNWLNMPYFGGDASPRHALHDGRALDMAGFLALAEERAVTAAELADWGPEEEAPRPASAQVAGPPRAEPSGELPDVIPEGEREERFKLFIGHVIALLPTLSDSLVAEARQRVHDANKVHCKPLWEVKELDELFDAILECERAKRAGGSAGDDAEQLIETPGDPDPIVYHGLAGQIVQALAPQSEAAPVALLAHLLVAVGNVAGRGAHFMVEGTPHYLNEYALIVGPTSSGRKGTAWGRIRSLFLELEAGNEWVHRHVLSSLASGEGLIDLVRDAETHPDPKDKTKQIVDRAGVEDKRVMVVLGEFAQLLAVMRREGNVTGDVLRTAWDWGTLQVNTRTNRLRATNVHASVVGHVTPDELREKVVAGEATNGFLNRFLIFYAQRSQYLPRGGRKLMGWDPLVERLRRRLLTMAKVGRLDFDPEAGARWEEVYPALTDGYPGLLGAVTQRGAAHVLRLACLYAALDGETEVIRPAQLEAALALWAYSVRSARFVFQMKWDDPLTDRVWAVLPKDGTWIGTEGIHTALSRNYPAAKLHASLAALVRSGMTDQRQVETGGRPRMEYRRKAASGQTLSSLLRDLPSSEPEEEETL